MNRILVIGAPPSVAVQHDSPTDWALERTGQNTGNLLITHGLLSTLDYTDMSFDVSPGFKVLAKEFDRVVIPAANYISPKVDIFESWARFLGKLKLPVLMVGLGAQAPSVGTKLEVPQNTINYLKVISDHCELIGVRGEYTADLLAQHGIKNVQITGCPSLYMNCDRNWRINKPDGPPQRVAINGSRNVTMLSTDPERHKTLEQSLHQLALKRGYDFILQNEMPELILSRGLSSEFEPGQLDLIRKKWGIDVPDTELLFYLCHHLKAFFDIPSWSKAIKEYDFTFGTRFHGNVISLLNGVPNMVLTHDSRTTELCNHFRLPNRPIQELDTVDPEKLYEEVSYDAFHANYPTRYDEYRSFLEANGMPHKLGAA